MAGGRWTSQSKVRPGAYINVDSTGMERSVLRMRGIVTMPWIGDFGQTDEIIELTTRSNFYELLGHDLNSPKLLTIREALKHASKVLLYRVAGGTVAAAHVGHLQVEAKYPGTRGNDIMIAVEQNIGNDMTFTVKTFIDMKQIDAQVVKSIGDLKANQFVTFSGAQDQPLNEMTAGVHLTEGTNVVLTPAHLDRYLELLEAYDFNTMAFPIEDANMKLTAINWIKDLRTHEGKKCQLVVADATPGSADDEAIINVKNGVILSGNNGEAISISAYEATAWVAGATAGADVNESNTYTSYDGAIGLNKDERYSNAKIINLLEEGYFLFTEQNGRIVVEQDINSLHSFTDTRNQSFAKNRVIRVLDDLANSIRRMFAEHFIGQVTNDEDGRAVFKVAVLEYMDSLQNMGAIENFSAEDIQIESGQSKDSIVANVQVQPTDAMEKLFMSVEVQ